MTSPDASDALEDLLSRAVQLLEQRGEPGLQELLVAHASQAEGIRAGLERLRRLGILAPPPAAPAERTQFGEFRVLRRIGAGGMGIVYAAEQTSLQRTVALKVVRPEFLLSTTARERFQREVEAIARLQHPGIVPILAVGNEDAQPWFAMEYIEGHTLDDLLATMRGKDPSRALGNALRTRFGELGGTASGGSAAFAGSYWEACVRLVHQVAATMSYVHERGIVHRDLKPSNIVVSRQGQAMVLDFGLAHVRDLHRVTHDDKPLGSPAYVSPEQVRGEAIDERVDIYGLGVTLYELLTTHLPFEHESEEALQQAILVGNARGVRTWNRAVPRDLDIVCAVALDRDRARRYRSMAEFAADLDAVLTRRPILARPLGRGLRLVRFAQRHPVMSIAAAALLVLALQFPLVLWRLQAATNTELARVNNDLTTVNGALDRQRALAVDSYTDALDAIQHMLVQTVRSDLFSTPGSEALQLSLLRRADAMYDQLRRKRTVNKRVEYDSAQNLQHIARRLHTRGNIDDAIRTYGEALTRLEPWYGGDVWHLRGTIHRLLGICLLDRGDEDTAERSLHAAVCDLELAVTHAADARDARRQLAETYAGMGRVHGQRQDRDSRLGALRLAQEWKDALYAEAPGEAGGALACALGCSDLASAFSQADHEVALDFACRGIEILQQLPAGDPTTPQTLNRLALLLMRRGSLYYDAKQYELSADDHGAALALHSGLAHDFPTDADHKAGIGMSCNNLSLVAQRLGDSEQALEWVTSSIVGLHQSLRMAPKQQNFQDALHGALANRSDYLISLRRFDQLAIAMDEVAAATKPPKYLLIAARQACTAAKLVRAESGQEAAQPWCDRAAAFVEATIANGFRDRARFNDKQFDPIRKHARFLDALGRLPQ